MPFFSLFAVKLSTSKSGVHAIGLDGWMDGNSEFNNTSATAVSFPVKQRRLISFDA